MIFETSDSIVTVVLRKGYGSVNCGQLFKLCSNSEVFWRYWVT